MVIVTAQPAETAAQQLRIVGIAGALRKGSLTKKLIESARPLFPSEVIYTVLEWDDVPIFNQDLETEDLMPPSVMRVREQVLHADALLIGCPEYNWSIPGPLKNLIDWLSRPYDSKGNLTRAADMLMPLAGKVVGICGLSPSTNGPATTRGQMALRQALGFPNCYVLSSPHVAIPGGLAVFEEDEDGKPLLELKRDSVPRSQMARLAHEMVLACGRQGRYGRKDGVV